MIEWSVDLFSMSRYYIFNIISTINVLNLKMIRREPFGTADTEISCSIRSCHHRYLNNLKPCIHGAANARTTRYSIHLSTHGHKRIFTTVIYALTEPDIAHKTQFSTAFSDFMEPSYDSCLQYTHNHFRIHTDP
jgi:hypothetical protein